MITEAEVREVHFAEAQKIDFNSFVQEYVAHRANEVAAALPVLKIVSSETMVNPDLAKKVFDQIYEPSFKVAEQYIQHLIDLGELSPGDPKIMARLFASPLLGLLYLRLLGDEHVAANWEKYTEEMTTFLINAYRHDDDRPAQGGHHESAAPD